MNHKLIGLAYSKNSYKNLLLTVIIIKYFKFIYLKSLFFIDIYI